MNSWTLVKKMRKGEWESGEELGTERGRKPTSLSG